MSGQNIEIVKLQVRRGPEAQLPTLDSGEPAITTDTNKFFIGDGTTNHQLANLDDLANVNIQLNQNIVQAIAINTTFNTDGSITETFSNGITKTTVFNTNGSITETFSAPINKTKTTTFNIDGSITEVLS